LFLAQSHSDDGHAANVETDPAPSDEELYRILTFLSRLFHLLLLPWQSKRLFVIQFSSDNRPTPKLYTHPRYLLLISYVLAQARPTMIYIH